MKTLASTILFAPLWLACATAPVGPSVTPVTLVQTCPRGPFCVTGQIDDQFALAVVDARCFVRTVDGQLSEVTSDARGVFLIDGLTALPSEIRFEKAGFESQAVPVLSGSSGSAARAYVTLQRSDDSDCFCEGIPGSPGQPACPPERCQRH
ncbi:MAG TPA: carboxypeptidase-like regulatory domain-containing protein [Polyangia bacterium]|nr:carboxypeptidase-like regulatory domain-containing protein [Polyangia bacterium]